MISLSDDNIFPVRILRTEGAIVGAELLLEHKTLQIGLSEPSSTRVCGKCGLLLDFGREISGGVRILVHLADGGNIPVRIRMGESVSECCAELGERGAGNHHSLRDLTLTLPMLSDQTFFDTGFRFVRIDFLGEGEALIKAVVAREKRRALSPVGSFRCNDKRVNEIFNVASHTLFLNMRDRLWDGVKRDRLVWVGDMHPEAMGVMCLFGKDESVERSLDFCMEQTPLPGWMNGIPTYTAWWLVILYDYWMQNGNTEYLLSKRDYIRDAFILLDGLVREDGALMLPEECLFDWPSHGSLDEREGIRALLTLTSEKCSKLFSVLGMDNTICLCMTEKLMRGTGRVHSFKQCEAFRAYAGLARPEESCAFLTKDGAQGMSTFMSYYILSAVTDAGRADRAVAMMKEYYGGMLDMGATSFWEDFDLSWMENSAPIDRFPEIGEKDIHGDFGKHCYAGFRHSLCHGWSCGPIAFLMRKLGGLEILEAGSKKLSIRPVSGGLEEYEICYPIPQGTVHIAYRHGKSEIEVPRGVFLKELK